MISPHQQPQWPPASSLRAPQLCGSPDTHWQKGGLRDPEECWGGEAATDVPVSALGATQNPVWPAVSSSGKREGVLVQCFVTRATC